MQPDLMPKKALRREAIASRQCIPHQIWQQRSQNICQNLAAWQPFQQAQTILAYQSFRQEPDLSFLWEQFPHKTWGFPRCVEQDLAWHQVNISKIKTSMVTGHFGIQEPQPHLPLVNLHEVDMILIPAVACDRTGYRLGYGGGFYDRWLRACKDLVNIKVGIIFADYFWAQLPHDAWDMAIDAICTESEIFEAIASIQTI
jgi:5-formyltetrahydrofolate cyclo-ligase